VPAWARGSAVAAATWLGVGTPPVSGGAAGAAGGDAVGADCASVSDRISAIGVRTGTVCPTATRIRPSRPLAGDGTSWIPLSISTVSSGSSFWIESPSCLSHAATVPSSIVRPSTGIVTGVGTD